MNNTLKLFLAIALMALPKFASAQKNADPEGFLTYSLPSTSIVLEVEAVQEKFYVGPYAKYAEKYLGIKARQKDETSFQLTEIKMLPLIEADQSRRYSVNVKKGQIDATFLKLASVGLISFSDAKFGDQSVWRFPTEGQGDFSGKGVSSNLTSQSATLYRSDESSSAYDRVAVQQDMLVGKTLEQRAAETADMILKLRKQRLQIVTGDTDATYSGEAMGAAIGELARLEQEYMTLFVGYSEYQTQKMRFEVIPDAANEGQMYVAFRVSDKAGLLPADEMNGRPIIMEIEVPQIAQVVTPEQLAEQAAAEKAKAKGKKAPKPKPVKEVPSIYYRIPATCTVKIKEGTELLFQTRIPVYQLGQESSVPLKTALN